MLYTQIPGFDSLVRWLVWRALARRDCGRSYGYPYLPRYIKIHVLPQGSHREGPGVRFPTISGNCTFFLSAVRHAAHFSRCNRQSLQLVVPGSIPGVGALKRLVSSKHPVSIPDPASRASRCSIGLKPLGTRLRPYL